MQDCSFSNALVMDVAQWIMCVQPLQGHVADDLAASHITLDDDIMIS